MKDNEKIILGQIRETVKNKDPQAEIILFGSRATGTAKAESYWDLLILLDRDNVSRKTEQEFRHALIDAELETAQAFSTFVFSRSEWETKYQATPFYRNVKKEGMRIG